MFLISLPLQSQTAPAATVPIGAGEKTQVYILEQPRQCVVTCVTISTQQKHKIDSIMIITALLRD